MQINGIESNAALAAPDIFSLQGKKGLVLGIANDQSIAWGCAQLARKMGGRYRCHLY